MSKLPIVDQPSNHSRPKSRWAIPVHTCRVFLFVGVLLLIRQKHIEFNRLRPNADSISQILPDQISTAVPDAVSVHEWDPASQSRSVVNSDGKPVATLIQTSPASDSIVGYLGPTNVMVVLNPQQKIVHVEILESADTIEHVDEIRDSNRFLDSFAGLPWNRPEHWPEIDAVSGATLTSYAIIQGVRARAGGQKRALKFPNDITREEVKSILMESGLMESGLVESGIEFVLKPALNNDQLIQIRANEPAPLLIGFLARTSPTTDGLAGYQGPTDALLVFDDQMKLVNLKIRASFDNQPYVGYVKDDSYLTQILAGKSLSEISSQPIESYEGVSGATMTSLNVWEGVRLTANEIAESIDQEKMRADRGSQLDLPWRDIATGVICILGVVIGLTQLRKRKRFRFCYLILVIVYLGFISGDMLSQALLVGWTQNGFPTSVAPGLVFLCIAALLIPMFSKHNVYCNHICPMGAIQQVSKNLTGRRLRLSGWFSRCLKLIPALLIMIVLLTAFKQLEVNLASVEAFDAFSFRVAGWTTIFVAMVGMITSLFVPMAYCRFGCPTGAVLDFVRFNANSHKIGVRDGLAIAAIGLGLIV